MPKTSKTLKPSAFAKTWMASVVLVFPRHDANTWKDHKERLITLSVDPETMTIMVSEKDEKLPAGFYVIADSIDPIGRWQMAAREVAAELVGLNIISAEDVEKDIPHLAALIKAMTEAMPPEDEIPE
jgi:hypothetical protein